MALSTRRERVPARAVFGRALVLGRSERETRTLIEQAYPLVEPGSAVAQHWPSSGAPRGSQSPDAVMSGITRSGHDLVMKALDPADDRPGAALDALDVRLIRDCPCPVWLAEPAVARPVRRVLAAIDPIVDERVAQATTVLSLAAEIAGGAGGELHVLHAWVAYGESLLRPRVPAEELREYVTGEREAAAARVERTLAAAHLRLPRERVHLVKGDFPHVLRTIVTDERIDLVVMGTRGRRGWLASALVRPYAELILRRSCARAVVVVGRGIDGPPDRR